MELLEQISISLQKGDHQKVYDLTKEAINNNLPPKEILDDGLLVGMNVISEKFRMHEIFLPHVLLAAKAMYAGLDQLKPLFIEGEMPNRGKVVIGTVHGDLHDIGKNLVGIMLKGAGFEVIDLGKNVPAENFVETAISEEADVIGMSTLLTTTVPVMKNVIELLKSKQPNGKVKTIIGGAPITGEVAMEMGATTYGYDAANAVERVKQLVGDR
ncbi:MAG: corrinoid protein [Candidatus Hatepunaea meridiana]|nr:corrinoid protein [Candidatus Hatepunaea meridiana]